MNEKEAMAFIEESARYGMVPGLDSVRELCSRLDDPQNELKVVHIAGTNGKGSVSAYIASVLKAGGYCVGRYISPVIFNYRERIQVGDRNITVKALCQGMERIKEVCQEMVSENLRHPTAFEIETALAFLYFKQKQCDIVVLETGMGGLMDATNIVENTLTAVIASVSMDHMKFLGNSLAEIAAQKAGIIKPGSHVISTAQSEDVEKVISEKAESLNCPLIFTDVQAIKNVRYGLEKQRFDYKNRKKLEISLAGKFQLENAAAALDVIDVLGKEGFPVSEGDVYRGLADAKWPGRFTVIGKKPYFVVDGAHNEDAAKRLAESIDLYFTNKRIIYIMGVLKDKEYEKIIGRTVHYADHIITVTPPENPRALPAYELAKEISALHSKVTAADSLEEAVEMSVLLAEKEDVIIAFGSLSFLGRLMSIVEKKTGKAVR